MKRIVCLAVIALLLAGCAAEPTFETVGDLQVQSQPQPAGKILLDLPSDAQLQTSGTDSTDKLYLCDEFTVSVQTMAAGDLDKTLRSTTGYGKEDLTLMQQKSPEGMRYRCVWTAAGEGNTLVGKTCIVDDGNYHYVLTVMVPENAVAKQESGIRDVMNSFQIVPEDFGTGS